MPIFTTFPPFLRHTQFVYLPNSNYTDEFLFPLVSLIFQLVLLLFYESRANMLVESSGRKCWASDNSWFGACYVITFRSRINTDFIRKGERHSTPQKLGSNHFRNSDNCITCWDYLFLITQHFKRKKSYARIYSEGKSEDKDRINSKLKTTKWNSIQITDRHPAGKEKVSNTILKLIWLIKQFAACSSFFSSSTKYTFILTKYNIYF